MREDSVLQRCALQYRAAQHTEFVEQASLYRSSISQLLTLLDQILLLSTNHRCVSPPPIQARRNLMQACEAVSSHSLAPGAVPSNIWLESAVIQQLNQPARLPAIRKTIPAGRLESATHTHLLVLDHHEPRLCRVSNHIDNHTDLRQVRQPRDATEDDSLSLTDWLTGGWLTD